MIESYLLDRKEIPQNEKKKSSSSITGHLNKMRITWLKENDISSLVITPWTLPLQCSFSGPLPCAHGIKAGSYEVSSEPGVFY